MKKKTMSLRNQLFLAWTSLLLLLVLVIGASQHYVMEQYLLSSRITAMESQFHNFMTEELEEAKALTQSQAGTAGEKESESDSNEEGAAAGGSSPAEDESAELKDKEYVLGKMVSREVAAAYINLDGTIGDTAVFNQEPRRNGTEALVLFGGNHLPLFTQAQYLSFLNENMKHQVKSVIMVNRDRYGEEYLTIFRALKDGGETVALIQLSSPTSGIRTILNDQTRVFSVIAILIVIVGSLFILLILSVSLKPIRDMSATVEKISVGNLDIRLDETKGQREVQLLAGSFNGVLERMESAFKKELETNEKMRRFVSDASHELKTPITSIHGFVEVLLRGAAKDQKQLDAALGSILMESDRLGSLVNDLLILTRLEREQGVIRKDADLGKLVSDIEGQLKVLAGERTLDIEYCQGATCMAYVNEGHIKQILYNLIQNGIQHTDPTSGRIGLRIWSEEDFIVLEISDNGSGIPEKDIAHIFDRFYRVDGHRSRKQGGNGLGLSIVKGIVDSHGGRITVASRIQSGTTFRVYLPK